jgi:hypothetical protein
LAPGKQRMSIRAFKTYPLLEKVNIMEKKQTIKATIFSDRGSDVKD